MSIGYQNHLALTPAGRGIAALWVVLAGACAVVGNTLFGLLLGLLLCVLILLVLLTGDASY